MFAFLINFDFDHTQDKSHPCHYQCNSVFHWEARNTLGIKEQWLAGLSTLPCCVLPLAPGVAPSAFKLLSSYPRAPPD